jgi:hypothetical protein
MLGVQGINPFQSSQSFEKQADIKELSSALKDLTDTMKGLNDKVFDSESQMVSKEQAGQKTEKPLNESIQQKNQPKAHQVEEMLAELISVFADDEIDKKKKVDKKTKFEEKMKELAELADSFETENLSEDEKAIFEEFKANMSKIGNMQSQLNQLNRREAYLEDLLEQQEKEKKDKEQKSHEEEQEEEKE